MSTLNLSFLNNMDKTVSTQQDVKQLKSYFYQLTEQLRYVLNNLEADNLTDGAKEEITAIAQKEFSRTIRDELGGYSTIKQTGDMIATEVGSIDGRMSTIEQTVNGVTTTVTGLNGRMSSVEQTASALTSTVTGLSGRVSAIEQKPEGVAVKLHDAGDNFSVTVANQNLGSIVNGYGERAVYNGSLAYALGYAGSYGVRMFSPHEISFLSEGQSATGQLTVGGTYPIWSTVVGGHQPYLQLDGTNGYVYGSSTIHTGSDRRLKTDIAPIANAGALFDALRPVQFRMISQGENAPINYGFIAQDVKEALDSAGIGKTAFLDEPTDRSPFYGLAYDQFIALCVAKIQSQQAQIDDLEARITALEDNHD